jgi:hypothetical protein
MGVLDRLGHMNWKRLQPESLVPYLEEECAALRNATLMYLPDGVRVMERHELRPELVRGKKLARVWPNCMGWSANGTSIAIEALGSTHPNHLRFSLIYHRVHEHLAGCARDGGKAWVLARSAALRDYLIPVHADGTIGEWDARAVVRWSDLEPYRIHELRAALDGLEET